MRACAPPVQHLSCGGYIRNLHVFQGRQRHHGHFGAPEKEKEGGRGEQLPESQSWPPLSGIPYADDAGVVLQSPGQLRKVIGVIVVLCLAFVLTISEAETEIMCLRMKGLPESTVTFSLEAAEQVYNQTNEFVYLGGNVNCNADLFVEVNPCIHEYMVQLPKVHPRTVRPTERSCRAQHPDAQSRGTRDNAVRLRHVEPARVHQAYHSFLTRCIGLRKNNRDDHPIFYLDTLTKTGSESIETTLLPRRQILFTGFVARMEDTKLLKCVMFGELVGGVGCVGGQEEVWTRCFLDDLRAFGINADQ